MRRYRQSFVRDVLEPFQADLAEWQRYTWAQHSPLAVLLLRHNGLRATLLHRLAHWASDVHIPFVPTVLAQVNLAMNGIEITPSTPVGSGLYMPHTTGTVIGARRIGAGVTLQGGITVGTNHGPALPIIEDGALLGAGCRVVGAIRIGRDARVGANAVVLHDVPDGFTALGVPAVCRPPRAAEPDERQREPVVAANGA